MTLDDGCDGRKGMNTSRLRVALTRLVREVAAPFGERLTTVGDPQNRDDNIGVETGDSRGLGHPNFLQSGDLAHSVLH